MVRNTFLRLYHRLAKPYFQLEVEGLDHLKSIKYDQVMFVMNHTATIGLEVYLFGSIIAKEAPKFDFTTLVWSGFSDGLLKYWFKIIDCRRVSIKTGIDLLKSSKNVMIMPEGVEATDLRTWFHPFDPGYLHMLRKQPVPIIPVGFYGVDQSIPWHISYNSWLVKKIMKPINPEWDFINIPKLPIFRPVKIVFSIGEAIPVDSDRLKNKDDIDQMNEKVQDVIKRLAQSAKDLRDINVSKNGKKKWYYRLLDGKITEAKSPKSK